MAREYGIPAVLGVGNGTVRIKHGQSITIDGGAGSVTLHEEGATAGGSRPIVGHVISPVLSTLRRRSP
ncbi:MAG: hypothetical protein J4F38_04830 [Pseudomonadales bacterium]|nr:hypothetical protein [Pseudomonadales bacterium]